MGRRGRRKEKSMKILVASDIHGSASYAEQLLEAFRREEADKLLLLGDILYHGPRNDLPAGYAPKKVIELLSPLRDRILCVRGNCDTEVDQMVLPFPILADYCLLYIGNRAIFATHGHNHNEEKLPPLGEGDILLHGHTHIPVCADRNGYTYMNPGSVSIPKEGSAHSYMTLTDEGAEWKTLDGDCYMTYRF